MNILHRTTTGRQWGDKRDPAKASLKLEGIKFTIEAVDAWEGPCSADETGEYHRCYIAGAA